MYFAERTLNWGWQKLPRVTENGPVAWMLKGKDELVLKDDRGKEFTLTITKSRLKKCRDDYPRDTEYGFVLCF